MENKSHQSHFYPFIPSTLMTLLSSFYPHNNPVRLVNQRVAGPRSTRDSHSGVLHIWSLTALFLLLSLLMLHYCFESKMSHYLTTAFLGHLPFRHLLEQPSVAVSLLNYDPEWVQISTLPVTLQQSV